MMPKNNAVQQDQMLHQLKHMLQDDSLRQFLDRIPGLKRSGSQVYHQTGFSQLYQQLNSVLNGYLQSSIHIGQPAALAAQAAGKKLPDTGIAQPARLAKGQQADSNNQSGDEEQILALSEQDVMDIIKLCATEVHRGLKGEAFEKQAAGVIDTVLNRRMSGRWGGSIRSVINAPGQFSDINTKRKSAYGRVQNVPMSRVTGWPELAPFVRSYLAKRAEGIPSIVGGNLFYANPNALGEASPSTRKWVAEAEIEAQKSGHIFGEGKRIHVHGTEESYKKSIPKPFKIELPPAKPEDEGNGNSELKKAEVNSIPEKISTGKDNPQYGFYDGVYRLQRSLGSMIPAGVNAVNDSMSVGQVPADNDLKIKRFVKKVPINKQQAYSIVELEDGRMARLDGDRNWRNNNPGNVEYGDLARSLGAIASDGRFAVFPNYETGRKAKERLIFEGKNYKKLTLTDAIHRFAPPKENDTKSYQAAILAAVGNQNKIMSEYSLEERKKIMDAMQKREGKPKHKITELDPNDYNSPNRKADGSKNIMDKFGNGAGAKNQSHLIHKGASTNTSQHVETTVGTINIVTQATDAPGISQGIHAGLMNVMTDSAALNPYSANSGLV